LCPWSVGHRFRCVALHDLVNNGTLEAPPILGALGQESWFVTKFTAAQDPTIVSYMGLQSQENRHKLAETFLRPTEWKDYCYCALVTVDNCSTDDGVAKRPPQDESEYNRIFVDGDGDGLYTGHFRKTEENECDTYPNNCTGHIADYPCGWTWTSYIETQTFHLDIALASNGDEPGSRGYSYSQMTEMCQCHQVQLDDSVVDPRIHSISPFSKHSRHAGEGS
jgi:hypothetical protein